MKTKENSILLTTHHEDDNEKHQEDIIGFLMRDRTKMIKSIKSSSVK